MKNRQEKSFAPLEISNPNKPWVIETLDNLIAQWEEWDKVAQSLLSQPDSADYKEGSHAPSIKDGFANLEKHEVLREKTLVFLRNHFSGYEFILQSWDTHPHEDRTSRLSRVVPTWIHRLDMLKESLPYALVPEGFWKQKGKDLVDKIANVVPEKAAEIAASYLKNPL